MGVVRVPKVYLIVGNADWNPDLPSGPGLHGTLLMGSGVGRRACCGRYSENKKCSCPDRGITIVNTIPIFRRIGANEWQYLGVYDYYVRPRSLSRASHQFR